jgi:hypothetical protein
MYAGHPANLSDEKLSIFVSEVLHTYYKVNFNEYRKPSTFSLDEKINIEKSNVSNMKSTLMPESFT